MHYIWQHIKTIVESYNGSVPLTHYLRSYFKQYPKLGSRDRKTLSEMAYCWYRASKGFSKDLPFDLKMRACLFLCSYSKKLAPPLLPEALQTALASQLPEKLNILNNYLAETFELNNLFTESIDFSAGIDCNNWLESILLQPRLFIRIRKNKEDIVNIFQSAKVQFEWINDSCMVLPNTTAVDKLLPADCYVVQDASSQQASSYFQASAGQHWWDCCSGAGGKSLYLKDKEPSIQLTVSDIRQSILSNLRERFKLYGHKTPIFFTADSTNYPELASNLGTQFFDGIICDVPCTGSGTWARTPEQLYFFKRAQLKQINTVQKRILANAAKFLAPGAMLYYITCSVFKPENEDVVDDVLASSDMKLQSMRLINGIEKQADSLFIAVLKKGLS